MKLAISIKDNIFKEVEAAAKDLHCSRSEIFARAVSDFLEKQKSRKILEMLHEAYSDAESEEESRTREARKKRYAKAVTNERETPGDPA